MNDLVIYIESKESSETSTGLVQSKHANHAASAGAVGGHHKKCDKCGRQHDPAKCGAERKTCFNCNSKGHLSRCCTKPRQKKLEAGKKAAAGAAETGPEVKAEAVEVAEDNGHWTCGVLADENPGLSFNPDLIYNNKW